MHVLFDEDLADPGAHLAPHLTGLDDGARAGGAVHARGRRRARPASTPRTSAGWRASWPPRPPAAVYGRIGTTTQEFGSLASWLIDVLNVLTGNLDREGGAMFTMPAAGSGNTAGAPGRGRGVLAHRWTSRVSGRGEVFGEFPAACLAEEIDDARRRARSARSSRSPGTRCSRRPRGDRLAEALDTLDLMVSIDVYRNETTRHAARDPAGAVAARCTATTTSRSTRSPCATSRTTRRRRCRCPTGVLDEWQILLRLAGIASGAGPRRRHRARSTRSSPPSSRAARRGSRSLEGRDPQELMDAVAPRVGPERLLDLQLRSGPYGDLFGAREDGADARRSSRPRRTGSTSGRCSRGIPEVLRTASGMIELAPRAAAVRRAAAARRARRAPTRTGLLLIGRRQLRSNNSWMHNLPKLVSGPERCTVLVHPDDARAARRRRRRGGASSRARTGGSSCSALVTDDMMPGVISIPHGWGHDLEGVDMDVAREHAGVNVNVLGDSGTLEALTGTAVLNGIPVTLAPARQPAAV